MKKRIITSFDEKIKRNLKEIIDLFLDLETNKENQIVCYKREVKEYYYAGRTASFANLFESSIFENFPSVSFVNKVALYSI